VIILFPENSYRGYWGGNILDLFSGVVSFMHW